MADKYAKNCCFEIKRAAGSLLACMWITVALFSNGTSAAAKQDETMNAFANIPVDEILKGPSAETNTRPRSTSGQKLTAVIDVNAATRLHTISKNIYGMNIEDLNHEIYGGLYAQLIYGESFEEGPNDNLPRGWAWGGHVNQTWNGMKTFDGGIVTMQALRDFQLVWTDIHFEDGVIECDLMQPLNECEASANIIFRIQAGSREDTQFIKVQERYDLRFDMVNNSIGLYKGTGYRPNQQLAVAKNIRPSLKVGSWQHAKIIMQGGYIQVFVNHSIEPQIAFTDNMPYASGYIGFDSHESRAKFRNLQVMTDNQLKKMSQDISTRRGYGMISQWWDPVVTGTAVPYYAIDEENPYNTDRCQRMEFKSGIGTVGLANGGLNRRGLNIQKDWEYEGRLYLRGDYAGDVTLVLQDASGSKQYARTVCNGISRQWKQFVFKLQASATDTEGRFSLWLDKPGIVWVDQVVLMPDRRGLYKGLPIRKDLGEMIPGMGTKLLRWGGDASNPAGWRWKNLIGDPDKRRQFRHPWYPFQTAGFGVDEFLGYCQAADMQAIFELNQWESPVDCAEFVEYCNGTETTRWGSIRASFGHKKPFHLKYLKIGNGFTGVAQTAAIADAVHKIDPNITVIGGAITHHYESLWPDDEMSALSAAFNGKIPYISVLPYNDQFGDARGFELLIEKLKMQLGKHCHLMRLFSQEVNGGLHNFQRALCDMQYLNVCEKNGDFVDMVTYCNLLADDMSTENGWEQGKIYFDNNTCWLQPPGVAFQMANCVYRPIYIESIVVAPETEVAEYGPKKLRVGVLNVSATKDSNESSLVLKVVCISQVPVETAINIGGFGSNGYEIKTACLGGQELNAVNYKSQQTVKPAESKTTVEGNKFTYTFAPYSFTTMELRKNKK